MIKRSMQDHRRRRGYTRSRLLTSACILAAMAYPITKELMHARQFAHDSDAAIDRQEAWSKTLERLDGDAYRATEFSQIAPTQLQILNGGSSPIIWRVLPDGSMSRNGILMISQADAKTFSLTSDGAVLHFKTYDLSLVSPAVVIKKELQ